MNNKVCFITCINDDTLYEESMKYIRNLNIPEGYEVEFRNIRSAKSMTSGYNEAMNSSDAKYKVYLHQDTYIINKNFIYDILTVFNADDRIGMLGVIGAKTIPSDAIWMESAHKYGRVYESHTGKMELLEFKDVEKAYEEVKAIDGLVMVTQYDLSWYENVFDGWDFYDLSQSVEFTLKGYKVVIPKQEEPWCIHDCGLSSTNYNYEFYRKRFLDNYSSVIFPLVSVLIPTYNRPKYFELALESVLNQTYRNIEIIIGDDSTNNETEKLVKEKYLVSYDNIKYYHNKKNLGQFENDIKLYNIANGKFINYLMDDDLFENTKIEKMMKYFLNDEKEDISLITSHRAIIDNNDNVGNIFGNTENIFKEDIILNGLELGDFMLKTNFNCIGEPTTALFRKNKLQEPFGVYNGRIYGCNVDQAVWYNLLSKGNAVFINDILSYFRIHDNQQLATDKMKLLGALDYAHEVLTSKEKGFLNRAEDFKAALITSLKYCESVVNYFDSIDEKQELTEKLDELRENCDELRKKISILTNEKHDSGYINQKYMSVELDDKKIAFIVSINNYKEYEDCLNNIYALKVPQGFKIEIIPISYTKSIASGYNNAMKISNAMYKVYLKQSTKIINKNFIYDILNTFNLDDKIGMMGVIGSKTIPTNANWQESIHKYGKVYENKNENIELLSFKNVEENYEEVKAIDGLIMITQYDIPWREDIFDGYDFYALSHSVEFSLTGYKVVIPKQHEPWCISNQVLVKADKEYEKYRNIFLDEYSKDIFPLVSIIILTHNRPHYCKIALESAINQTYRNTEIIVSDDSDDERTKELIQGYLEKCKKIKYQYLKGATAKENGEAALRLVTGDYINSLMDDDIFHIEKLEKMMNYYLEYEDIELVTSFRQPINEYGDFIEPFGGTVKLFDSNTIIDGISLGKFVIRNLINVIGETTTILVKSKYYESYKFGEVSRYFGREYNFIADIITELKCLMNGKCAYLSDAMSFFRIHEEQDQNNLNRKIDAINDWYNLIKDSYKNKMFIENKDEYRSAMYKWTNLVMNNIDAIKYSSDVKINELKFNFTEVINECLFER